jgi:uncharacterized protein (DUF433 family)
MATALLGSGVYDAREVSRLLAEHVEAIVRWSAPDSSQRPAIVAPSLGRAFSFVDLVSLAVVSKLWKRHVSEVDLRLGVAYLREQTGYDKPLAHRSLVDLLATSGSALLVDLDGGWYDLGKRGHGAFEEVVRIYLKEVSYDDVGVAHLWRPAPMILLDPRVQAGSACVEGTRVPTQTIADMTETDSPQDVADELDLTVEQVRAAVDFEAGLLAGRSIAA